MAPKMFVRAGPGQPGHGALGRRHRIGDAFGVRPVAPDHVGVVSDPRHEAVGHLVGQRRHPHLPHEVLRGSQGEVPVGLAVPQRIEVGGAVDMQQEVRHPARRELDDADPQIRKALQDVPFRIRSAKATAGARYKKIESKSRSPSSGSP